MERRHFLKLAFGFAAGGIALAASAMPPADAGTARRRRQTAGQSRCATRRHLGRGGRSPHAGRSALGPRPASRLGPSALGMASPALGLAPPPLASQVLGLASPPSLAPPLLASSSLLLVRLRQGLLRQGIKKAPRERGFCHALKNISKRGSVRSATRCRKGTRGRAAPRRPEPVPRRPEPAPR